MRRYHGNVEATSVEARLKAFFEDDPRGALAVYLYGSVARGQARPDSDVDIGVLFATDPPATLEAPQFALEAALERLLGSPVQVVALNRAPSDLVHASCGTAVSCSIATGPPASASKSGRRNEYFDLAPIRRLYRRYPAPATAPAGRVAEPRR